MADTKPISEEFAAVCPDLLDMPLQAFLALAPEEQGDCAATVEIAQMCIRLWVAEQVVLPEVEDLTVASALTIVEDAPAAEPRRQAAQAQLERRLQAFIAKNPEQRRGLPSEILLRLMFAARRANRGRE